jgi:hypothetical protein
MQYSWLEKMTKEGFIRESVRDEIYADCERVLEKSAGIRSSLSGFWANVRPAVMESLNSPESWTLGRAIKTNLSLQGKELTNKVYNGYQLANAHPLLTGAGLYAGGQVLRGVSNAWDKKKETQTIINNRKAILADPYVGGYQDKAVARFGELVNIAPKAAENSVLSKKLVLDRLHSGFTANDYQSLAAYQAQNNKSLKDSQSFAQRVQKKLSKTASFLPKDDGEYCAEIYGIYKEAGALSWIGKTMSGSAGQVAKETLKTMGIVSGIGILSGIGTGIVNSISHKMDKDKLEERLRDSFNEVMKQSDPNREPLHANKDKAQKAFQTLVHFAPHVALDPSSARTFMNNVVSLDMGPQIGTIKELADIEHKMHSASGSSPFFSGFRAGSEAVGMQSAISKATYDTLQPLVGKNKENVSRVIGFTAPLREKDFDKRYNYDGV